MLMERRPSARRRRSGRLGEAVEVDGVRVEQSGRMIMPTLVRVRYSFCPPRATMVGAGDLPPSIAAMTMSAGISPVTGEAEDVDSPSAILTKPSPAARWMQTCRCSRCRRRPCPCRPCPPGIGTIDFRPLTGPATRLDIKAEAGSAKNSNTG